MRDMAKEFFLLPPKIFLTGSRSGWLTLMRVLLHTWPGARLNPYREIPVGGGTFAFSGRAFEPFWDLRGIIGSVQLKRHHH